MPTVNPPAAVPPASPPAAAPAEMPASRLAGPPIAFHVDDMDVRKALEVLSRQGNVNILVSPAVTGHVTLDVRDLPLDDILQAILRSCRLASTRDRDIIYVYPPGEEDQELEPAVRVYRLNYVTAVDLLPMIRPLLTRRGVLAATPKGEMGIKSDPDKVGGDSMAGSEVLVVQDCKRVLLRIDKVITELDVRPVQILIEAVIVSVELDKEHALGINFAMLGNGQNSLLGVMGNGSPINAAAGFVPATMVTAGKLAGSATTGFAEDMPGFKFGTVGKNITGFIRALETIGDTHILASPRIMVLNKQRAEIKLAQRLGYMSTTQTQTSTVQQVQFMDVGTQLRLRPFVADDGIIRMEIHPERSSGQLEQGIPQTKTSEVTTNVMIPDGTTMVIGGLMEKEDDLQEQGIPGLCHLPWIGFLFRSRDKTSLQRELVVILTPHIWRPGGAPLPPSTCPPAGAVPSPCLPQSTSFFAPGENRPQ